MLRLDVEMYFDYASPWCYVADYRISRELSDLPVRIHRIPVYLHRPVLREGVDPVAAARAAYMACDLARCARRYGIPLGTPAEEPVNDLYLLRGHLFLEDRPEAEPYRRAAFRATWVDGAHVHEPEVVVDVAVEAGVDRAEFTAGITSHLLRDQLELQSDRAVERGVFDVPMFVVDKEMFWGPYRLEHLRRHVEERICRIESLESLGDEL